jgi:glutamate-1-semialdehyde 2,1-aminomutase
MAVFGPGTRRGGRLAQVPHTGTFNGNPLSAAAGIALLEHIADGQAAATARAAAEQLVAGVNQAAHDEGVDVFLYANGSSVFHILIGARGAGKPLGPSFAIREMSKANPQLYAQLRRALLLEGLDTNPIHGWVSAAHDAEAIAFSVQAFARAFRRVRDVVGMSA